MSSQALGSHNLKGVPDLAPVIFLSWSQVPTSRCKQKVLSQFPLTWEAEAGGLF